MSRKLIAPLVFISLLALFFLFFINMRNPKRSDICDRLRSQMGEVTDTGHELTRASGTYYDLGCEYIQEPVEQTLDRGDYERAMAQRKQTGRRDIADTGSCQKLLSKLWTLQDPSLEYTKTSNEYFRTCKK